MSDNQTQYSKEFLQQVEELKKEIIELLQDKSLSKHNKTILNASLQSLSSQKNLKKTFAKRQLYLGLVYEQYNKLEKAINCYQRVKKEYDLETYSDAQLILGIVYERQNKLTEAIDCFNEVKKEYNKKNYAGAQFHLGYIYEIKNQSTKAIEYYQKVQQEDDPLIYNSTQYYIASIYHKQNKLEKAIEYYQKIQKEYPKVYSMAQFYLGIIYEKQEKATEAIDCFNKIQKEHNIEYYSVAQFHLGLIYYQENELTNSKNCFEQVQQYIPIISEHTQYYLAIICAKENNNEKYKIYIQNVTEYFSDDPHISKILDKIENKKITLKNKAKLLEILVDYLFIREMLLVVRKTTQEDKEERAFAHYTEVDTAINFFKEKEKWNFRMASVEQLNDPTEGRVLFEFINNYSEQLKQQNIMIEKSAEWAVFTACFTFNHDSLNQFRLYGKRQNQEATGVSLVFQPSFFRKSHSGIMNEIITTSSKKDIMEEITKRSTEQSKNNELEKTNTQITPNNDDMEEHDKQDEKTLLLPLYRCIYLDPNSFSKNDKGEKEPYLKIAARDELTFYRENDINKEQIEIYKNHTKESEEVIWLYLKGMIKNIEILFSNLNKSENNEEIFNILGLILLPLSHLIKHSAFHEEQECRIIYCCPFDDKRIDKTEIHKAKIFREYRPIINEKDIARIYLSKGAENYAHIFKSLGIKTVRVSSNPFRTAEKE